jgi:MraZ protein
MLIGEFIGRFEHSLDDKNRLTLPVKFRARFADGIMLAPGIEGGIDAYPPDEWRKLTALLDRASPFAEESRTMRLFLGSGSESVPDKQGRVIVPQPLIDEVELGRELVVTGAIDHLEIWDRNAWQARLQDMKQGVKDAAQRLAAEHD